MMRRVTRVNRSRIGDSRRWSLGRLEKVAPKAEFVISQVPHGRQRYETVGDWVPGKPTEIRVSRMKDQRYMFLVALHELVEYELCKKSGISDSEVVAFDMAYEEERRMNLHAVDAEPGDDPRAPYRDEHEFATAIEKIVARKLGVSWSAYERAVVSLGPRKKVALRPMAKVGLKYPDVEHRTNRPETDRYLRRRLHQPFGPSSTRTPRCPIR